MSSPPGAWRRRAARVLAEPVVHFFALGALLFVAHRLFVGAPRTVVVTPGVKSGAFAPLRGRERARARAPRSWPPRFSKWKVDEALSREALRERLDRDDPGIRTILADKMRLRAAFELPKREPTDAELDAWLAAHRSLYADAARATTSSSSRSRRPSRARGPSIDEFERALQQGKSAGEPGAARHRRQPDRGGSQDARGAGAGGAHSPPPAGRVATHRDPEELRPRAREERRRRGAHPREARRAAGRRLEARHGTGGASTASCSPRSIAIASRSSRDGRAPGTRLPALLLRRRAVAGAARARRTRIPSTPRRCR